MKIKSVKLREAHKGSSNGSFCSILWDLQAHHLVLLHHLNPLFPFTILFFLRVRRGFFATTEMESPPWLLAPTPPVLPLALLIIIYKFLGGEFETNITRFTLSIRALAFNKSGSMLAAAGDDEGIKLINTIDGSIARVLKGHRGPVTGLAFDPNGEYLASIDSIGTVIYWELQSGRTLHILKGVAPDTGLDTSILNVLSWSPDGETLAGPGLKNDSDACSVLKCARRQSGA
ncbi:hypothetical protein PTKIN_Ptkin05aG0185600 [Pterospermum kingtungense]